MWIALVIGLIVALMAGLKYLRHTSSTYPLHLLDDGSGNEALIIEAVVAHERVLFLVDTAYAGAPVLSVSYMNCLRKNRRLTTGSLRRRFRSTMLALETPMTTLEKHETLNEYVGRGTCKTFTSGCTMRLMGIGETSENQSDMFLCPPIALDGRPSLRWDADVFVTNPLHGSPHILTSDYLLHHGPTLLEPARGRLTLRAAPALGRFDLFDAHLVGGAFLIPIQVGEAILDVVVDTGASTTLSIGLSATQRIQGSSPTQRRVYQSGVNGENICSDVVVASVVLGSTSLGRVEVLFNSSDVESADGYVGIGILRAFDLYLSHETLGLRPNGLPVASLRFTTSGTCVRD